MRRKDREITDPAELHRILADARVCRVALVDGARAPLPEHELRRTCVVRVRVRELTGKRFEP
jgi:nitroimidazol reductase NimA-like FMN-containing flavoprotein (pyridoxamine 5'-phosphate oxidase superfamily)